MKLSTIPEPSDKRLAIRITPDATRHLRRGHPWIYDQAITKRSHDGKPGDLAVIFDKDRSFLAIGLYDPGSPIRIKVLHEGSPKQIDQDFWNERLTTAERLRGPLKTDLVQPTTGYRCVNGENDGLPGLILDRYADTYVLKLYSEAWFPHLSMITQAIIDVYQPESVILRLSRSVQKAETFDLVEGDALVGPKPVGPVLFSEYGLTFEADVVAGQKTGHFLDQRQNRKRIGELADGADVLDVFSCTGGFSVHAAAGGAASVLSVDQSGPALATARANMAHNQTNPVVAACAHTTRQGDAYQVMAALRGTKKFDVVVVDPPSFAQKQSSISAGINSYSKLTEAAVPLVNPGGILLQASCSSRISVDQFFTAVRSGAETHGRSLEILEHSTHALDHPVTFEQGSYLKALVARVG